MALGEISDDWEPTRERPEPLGVLLDKCLSIVESIEREIEQAHTIVLDQNFVFEIEEVGVELDADYLTDYESYELDAVPNPFFDELVTPLFGMEASVEVVWPGAAPVVAQRCARRRNSRK